MDFKAWKDRVWKASTRIKAYLKVFFSKLLKGKLGKNTFMGLMRCQKPATRCSARRQAYPQPPDAWG